MKDREKWLAETLVLLADTLTADFDVIDFMSTLVEGIQGLIDASEVGLMLADPQGNLRVMAYSTERMRLLELLEVQSNEGPCLECYRSGASVLNVDLEGAGERWPVFTPMAKDAGFRMVHALPMRLRDQVIGATNVFHSGLVVIDDSAHDLAQALADVATIGLLQERALSSASTLTEQLQHALNSRVVIEQAKGAVAERAGVDMNAAFEMLRSYARGKNRHLGDVALDVVERRLPVEALRSPKSAAADLGLSTPPKG
jgi:hypothetical protein